MISSINREVKYLFFIFCPKQGYYIIINLNTHGPVTGNGNYFSGYFEMQSRRTGKLKGKKKKKKGFGKQLE